MTSSDPEEGHQPMTAQPATPAEDVPFPRGPHGRPVPPAPTAQEIEEAARRRREEQEEADRIERDTFTARRDASSAAAIERAKRLAALAAAEFEKAGAKPGHDHTETDGAASWTDVREHQASVRAEMWERDIQHAGLLELAGWTVADIEDPRVKALVQGFANQIGRHKTHLLLTGNTGSGKTSVALGVGNAAVQGGRLTRLVTHKAYIAAVTARGLSTEDRRRKDTYRDRLQKAPVLVLDDLGAGYAPNVAAPAEVTSETLDLISPRWGSGLTTIVTTNFSSEEIRVMFGDQLLSRLGADSVVVEFTGPDLRGTVSWGGGKTF